MKIEYINGVKHLDRIPVDRIRFMPNKMLFKTNKPLPFAIYTSSVGKEVYVWFTNGTLHKICTYDTVSCRYISKGGLLHNTKDYAVRSVDNNGTVTGYAFYINGVHQFYMSPKDYDIYVKGNPSFDVLVHKSTVIGR
jgi:hypothetical protein